MINYTYNNLLFTNYLKNKNTKRALKCLDFLSCNGFEFADDNTHFIPISKQDGSCPNYFYNEFQSFKKSVNL